MSATKSANEVLDECYLQVRAKLLEIAACLDRIDRAEDSELTANDPRLKQIQESLKILGSAELHRAEQVQIVFSDAYVPGWNR